MKAKFALIISLALLLPACKYSDKFRVMERDHFIVEMPPYLSKTMDLHPKAPVQGRNGYRDVYFLVAEHEHSATDSLFNDNMDTISARIKNFCRDPYEEKDSAFTVNGLSAKYRRITGIIDDKRLVFVIALVRGKNYDYEITGWMFDNKRGLWLKDLHKAMNTFKEK